MKLAIPGILTYASIIAQACLCFALKGLHSCTWSSQPQDSRSIFFSAFLYLPHDAWIFLLDILTPEEGNGTPLLYSCLENPRDGGAWWAAVHGVTKSWTWLSYFTFTFHFHALEKEMATNSSVLAWRIPGTVESGGLPSMGLHRVGHDWSDLANSNSSYNLWALYNANSVHESKQLSDLTVYYYLIVLDELQYGMKGFSERSTIPFPGYVSGKLIPFPNHSITHPTWAKVLCSKSWIT